MEFSFLGSNKLSESILLLQREKILTLNILNSLKALKTERPKEPPLTSDQTTSKMEPDMTTQSNRLNEDSK